MECPSQTWTAAAGRLASSIPSSTAADFQNVRATTGFSHAALRWRHQRLTAAAVQMSAEHG
jgi:hypothetical protein